LGTAETPRGGSNWTWAAEFDFPNEAGEYVIEVYGRDRVDQAEGTTGSSERVQVKLS